MHLGLAGASLGGFAAACSRRQQEEKTCGFSAFRVFTCHPQVRVAAQCVLAPATMLGGSLKSISSRLGQPARTEVATSFIQTKAPSLACGARRLTRSRRPEEGGRSVGQPRPYKSLPPRLGTGRWSAGPGSASGSRGWAGRSVGDADNRINFPPPDYACCNTCRGYARCDRLVSACAASPVLGQPRNADRARARDGGVVTRA